MNMKKMLYVLVAVCMVTCLLFSTFAFAENLPVPEGSDVPIVVPGQSTTNPSGTTNNHTIIYDNSTSNGVVVIDSATGKPPATPTPTVTPVTTAKPVTAATSAVTKSPTSEICDQGDSVVFTARATGTYTIDWYITRPDGITYAVADINTYFKDVTATGANTERLVINNVTNDLNGCTVAACFTNANGTLWSGDATIVVNGAPEVTVSPSADPEASASPTVSSTATPLPTATPVAANVGGTAVQNGNTSSGSMMSGTTTYNSSNTAIGTDATVSEPTGESAATQTTYASDNGATSGGTAANTHVGAYILAALAGVVIIGSIVVMALYMKGKITLGKFEKFLGGFDGNGEEKDGQFYNPDDFKGNDDNKKT